LSKILGDKPTYLGKQKAVISYEKYMGDWAFLNYWGHAPGLPPKSVELAYEYLHNHGMVMQIFIGDDCGSS